MVVDCLYYSDHPFENKVQSSFTFDEQLLKDTVRRIYEKKFNPLTEIDEGIFGETWNIFNKATDEGFGFRDFGDLDFDFYQQIRYNNAVFSAFRTHRLQNDIAAQMLDENGKLKSFEKFSNDVQSITDHNVKNWLRTEYDTAILRAHRAADWLQFEKVKDILPNLRWMPTTSVTPDLVHKRYWEVELTLPQNHPFWTQHKPGDRWNCKCTLEATDEPVRGAHVLDDKDPPKPAKGLDNNPGVDGKLFSDTHPYIENAHKGAKKAVSNFIENKLLPLGNLTETEDMFKTYKKYKNGGKVLIHPEVNRKQTDYKDLLTIANIFAKEGNTVKLMPTVHFKSDTYRELFESLIGTPHERKCPDLKINDLFYEYENFEPPFKKRKVANMISHGAKQSSRIIINNNKGASDRFITRNVKARLKDENFKSDIDEVWLYEKGKVRLLFKIQ